LSLVSDDFDNELTDNILDDDMIYKPKNPIRNSIDEKKRKENNEKWKKRYSQNPYYYDRIYKEDNYLIDEHLHNLKKKEGKF
jgi:hypothetical protein